MNRSARLRLVAALAALAALPIAAQADPAKDNPGRAWPAHYDFFIPYGMDGSGPAYSKPGYKGVSLTLSCYEAKGLLKTRRYTNIEDLDCSGSAYSFKAMHAQGSFTIVIDPRTGRILKRERLKN